MKSSSIGWRPPLAILGLLATLAQAPASRAQPAIDPPPNARAWTDIANLPDWGGVWLPTPWGKEPTGAGTPPAWTPEAAARIEAMKAAEQAGRPQNVFVNCLPEGMPSFIIMTVAAVEFLFTPGRITMLGEFDGNRLRRIYTDGRPHPDDPDLTFNGHSIGRWDRRRRSPTTETCTSSSTSA